MSKFWQRTKFSLYLSANYSFIQKGDQYDLVLRLVPGVDKDKVEKLLISTVLKQRRESAMNQLMEGLNVGNFAKTVFAGYVLSICFTLRLSTDARTQNGGGTG